MEIDHLNAVAPRIAKIASERRHQVQPIHFCDLLPHFVHLLFVPDHDPKVPGPVRLELLHFENGQELMLAELKKRIALAALKLLQVEYILIELYRRLHIIHLNGQMVTSINVHAHGRSYPALCCPSTRGYFFVPARYKPLLHTICYEGSYYRSLAP